MAKTAIVTGARGFLGRYTARYLAAQGYQVVGLGNGDWPKPEQRAWGIDRWVQGTITVENLEGLNCTPDAMVHCAGSGSVPQSYVDPVGDFERTAVSTSHVLEFLRQHAPGIRLVYPSSASVYGNTPQSPISESKEAAPISPYGIHKLISEQLVRFHAAQSGIPCVIIRFFSIYGDGLRKQLLWDACAKLLRNEPDFMGTGEETRDWLHVEDAARLIGMGLDRATPLCPTVNGGAGDGIRVSELLEHLSRNLSSPALVPRFSGKVRPGDPKSYVADISLARQWGWLPQKPWKQGVADYVRWWKREQEL